MDLTVGPSNQNSRGLGHWVLDASGATWFLTTNPDFWSHKYASRSLFVTTTAAEKPRSKSLVQRTTDPASRKQALRLRLQTGHRTCRAAGAQPLIYDEHDRATEVQVRDASGEVVSRVVRTIRRAGARSRRKTDSGQSRNNISRGNPCTDTRTVGSFSR
jgi:hypothetical protein